MGVQFNAATTSAGAPDIEAGIYDAKFVGVVAKAVDSQFSTTVKDANGKDVPNSYEWAFALLDDTGAELYDDGDPVEVTRLTSMNMNIVSKTVPGAVKVLKAILTAGEYAAFESGVAPDSDAMIGRLCQVEVVIKDSGWPGVAQVLPARKVRAGRKAAE